MKKKVFFLIPYLQKGGSEKVIINLANGLSTKGFNCTIIVLNSNSDYTFLIKDNVNCINLNTNRVLFSFLKLRNLLKSSKPDILISALTHINVLACVSSLFLNIKVIVLEHIPVVAHIKQKWFNLIVYIFAIISYKQSDYVISSCQQLNYDLEKYLFISKNKIKTFYCPVVDNKYVKLANNKIDNIFINNKNDSETKIIISVARLEKQKDFKTAILSIKNLIDENYKIKYLILGKGTLELKLKKLVKKLKLQNNIFFLGFKKNPYKYISNSDLFLITSNYEAFGVVIVESLMLGVPVVSTDCYCGPSEIISDNKYGELAKVGDIESITNALKKALDKKYNKIDLKKRAGFFSVDNISNMYIDLINNKL